MPFLDCISDIIKKSSLPEQKLAEYLLSERNNYPSSFLCRNHKHLLSTVNREITNAYFNNEQKKLRGTIQNDNIKDFKQRQTKRAKIIILLLIRSDPMFPFVFSGSQNKTLAQNWLKMFVLILSIAR